MAQMNEKKRVLIIDDDEIVRMLIAKVVGKYDAEVVMARDGLEAQAMIRSKETFALILLDLLIPHVTGWDLLNEIRTNPLIKDVPVVVFTGASVSQAEKEALGSRVSAFVSKEKFDLAEFDKLVSSFLCPG
jgi:CheY-like chemotaxis protein